MCSATRESRFQGVSAITERKEFEIGGVAQMRLTQLKSDKVAWAYDRVYVADVFSGSGENTLTKGEEEVIIDGSPLRLLSAFREAITKGQGPMALGHKPISFLFSDIRREAIDLLGATIYNRWQPINNVQTHVQAMDAADAINHLWLLMRCSNAHLILVLDPNGVKAFPYVEVLRLLRDFGGRIDIVPNISATTLKRCIGARQIVDSGYNSWWLSTVERLDDDFVRRIAHNRAGWIREAIKGDNQQWMMIPTFTPLCPPRSDWAKQGYVDIASSKGEDAIQFYSNTRSALCLPIR